MPRSGKKAARLPSVRRLPNNTPASQRGRIRISARFAAVTRGGTDRPFLGSRRRNA